MNLAPMQEGAVADLSATACPECQQLESTPEHLAHMCQECGFSKNSEQHKRGLGLHGHARLTKGDADEQRDSIFAAARAFEAGLKTQELISAVEAMNQDDLEMVAVLVSEKLGLDVGGGEKPLRMLKRHELEEFAETLGIDNPAEFKNINQLVEAITARRAN